MCSSRFLIPSLCAVLVQGFLSTPVNAAAQEAQEAQEFKGETNVVVARFLNAQEKLIVGGQTVIPARLPLNQFHLPVPSEKSQGLSSRGSDNHWFLFSPSFGRGAYNHITQPGDAGIIFSSGLANSNSAFLIAPWNDTHSGLRITSAGDVGIGTTFPQARLDVGGSGLIAKDLEVRGQLVVKGRVVAPGLETSNDGPVLKLLGATNAYIELFPQGQAFGRKAVLGYSNPSPDVHELGIVNEFADGDIWLHPRNASHLGNVGVSGNIYADGNLQIALDAILTGSVVASMGTLHGPLSFSGNTNLEAHAKLTDSAFAIGVQYSPPTTQSLIEPVSLYQRSNGNFKWYLGGTYTSVASPGKGGREIMSLGRNSLTLRGGDGLAELFEITSQRIEPGQVVVIDETHPGHLRLSDTAYDRKVAGIVSGANGMDPGITLKPEGVSEGDRNVALSGRVFVKADNSNGSITPGDLLTTSATPGNAMKVTDHVRSQGAILGKAMSSLNASNGMVLVLVTLQ